MDYEQIKQAAYTDELEKIALIKLKTKPFNWKRDIEPKLKAQAKKLGEAGYIPKIHNPATFLKKIEIA